MLVLLSILFISIVGFKYIQDTELGIFFYLLLTIFAPYITIASYIFRIEMIATPILLLITILKKRNGIRLTAPFLIWLVFIFYCLIVSFLNNIKSHNSSINYIVVYNYFRFSALILIGANLNQSYITFLKWKKYIFLTSMPITILSIGVMLQNSLAKWITSNFYTSPTRSVYFSQIESLDMGYIFRSIGVFENVSYYATYILIVLSIGFSFLIDCEISPIKRRYVIYCIIVNFIAGVSTSSVTFYAGFLIIVSYFFLKQPISVLKSLSLLTILTIILGIFFWNIIQESLQGYIDVFNYLFTSFLEGDKISGRYMLSNRETGDLSVIFKETWIFGNGFRYYDNLLVNDSLFLEFFYVGGFFGSALLVCFIFSILYYSVISKVAKENKIYLIFVVLFVAGVGCNSFLIPRLSEWLWILIGLNSFPFVNQYKVSAKYNLI
jgi:hypothetical protein